MDQIEQENPEKPKRKPKNAFTEKEDQILKSLVKEYGRKDWSALAKFLPNRTARQCRERYNLYLRDDVSNTPWTDEEDELLIRLYSQMGPKWSLMTQNFTNRTANNIKNRFKQHQRHLKRHSWLGGSKGVISDQIVLTHYKYYSQLSKERQQQEQRDLMQLPPQHYIQIEQSQIEEPKDPNLVELPQLITDDPGNSSLHSQK